MIPPPNLPGRWVPTFRANPHLRLFSLTIPFVLIAIYYHAEWAAWVAVGIWFAVCLLHLFIGRKPPPEYHEKDEFGQDRFYH